jgi:hypothetical protein
MAHRLFDEEQEEVAARVEQVGMEMLLRFPATS